MSWPRSGTHNSRYSVSDFRNLENMLHVNKEFSNNCKRFTEVFPTWLLMWHQMRRESYLKLSHYMLGQVVRSSGV